MRLTGEEGNRWEEQLHLGSDPEAGVDHSLASEETGRRLKQLREVCRTRSVRAVADAAGYSVGEVARIRSGQGIPTEIMVTRLQEGLAQLRREGEQRAEEVRKALEGTRNLVETRGLRGAARELKVSLSFLSRVLSSSREMSRSLLARLTQHRAAPTAE